MVEEIVDSKLDICEPCVFVDKALSEKLSPDAHKTMAAKINKLKDNAKKNKLIFSFGACNGFGKMEDFIQHLFESELKTDDADNNVWLAYIKPDTLRFGPGQTPLPGTPTLIYCYAKEFYVCLLPMAGIIAEGLTLSQMGSFLEGEFGSEYHKNNGKLFCVPEGDRFLVTLCGRC